MKPLSTQMEPVLHFARCAVGGRLASERLIGLDISGEEVKLAVILRRRGKASVEAYCVETVDSEPGESEEALWPRQRDLLRSLVKQHRLEGVNVVAALPFGSYSRREIILPRMPGKELKKAILLETRKFSDRPLEETIVQFVTVNTFKQEGVRYASHLVVSIERTVVVKMISRLRDLGLRPAGFSVVPLAVGNVLSTMEEGKSDTISGVLDVGKDDVSFTLFRGSELVFTRDIPGSGNALTDSLLSVVVAGAEPIELTHERAEQIKVHYGITGEDHYLDKTDEGIPLGQVNIMMRPVLERMLVEIQRSIDFCQEQYRVDPPSIVFLSGGGSRLKNFSGFLRARLHLDVESLDPLQSLSYGPKVDRDKLEAHKIDLVTAIGLGLNLGGAQHYFMPSEFRPRDYQVVKTSLRAAAAVTLVVALASVGVVHLKYVDAQRSVIQKRGTLDGLRVFESEHEAEAEELLARKFRHDALLGLLGATVPWGAVLKDLSHRVDKNMQLTEVGVAKRARGKKDEEEALARVVIKGLLSTAVTRPEDSVARLLSQLNASPFFDDVRLEGVRALQEDIATVEVSCALLY